MRVAVVAWAMFVLTACASTGPAGSEKADRGATEKARSRCVGLPVVTEGGKLGEPPPLHCPE